MDLLTRFMVFLNLNLILNLMLNVNAHGHITCIIKIRILVESSNLRFTVVV